MKYDEWYNKGVELGYLRKYTTSMVATLASNIQMLEKAFTQSVQDQLGKSQTEMMEKYGNQLYWLMIITKLKLKMLLWILYQNLIQILKF